MIDKQAKVNSRALLLLNVLSIPLCFFNTWRSFIWLPLIWLFHELHSHNFICAWEATLGSSCSQCLLIQLNWILKTKMSRSIWV